MKKLLMRFYIYINFCYHQYYFDFVILEYEAINIIYSLFYLFLHMKNQSKSAVNNQVFTKLVSKKKKPKFKKSATRSLDTPISNFDIRISNQASLKERKAIRTLHQCFQYDQSVIQNNPYLTIDNQHEFFRTDVNFTQNKLSSKQINNKQMRIKRFQSGINIRIIKTKTQLDHSQNKLHSSLSLHQRESIDNSKGNLTIKNLQIFPTQIEKSTKHNHSKDNRVIKKIKSLHAPINKDNGDFYKKRVSQRYKNKQFLQSTIFDFSKIYLNKIDFVKKQLEQREYPRAKKQKIQINRAKQLQHISKLQKNPQSLIEFIKEVKKSQYLRRNQNSNGWKVNFKTRQRKSQYETKFTSKRSLPQTLEKSLK